MAGRRAAGSGGPALPSAASVAPPPTRAWSLLCLQVCAAAGPQTLPAIPLSGAEVEGGLRVSCTPLGGSTRIDSLHGSTAQGGMQRLLQRRARRLQRPGLLPRLFQRRCSLLQRRCCLTASFAAPLLPGPVFCSAAAAWPCLLQRRCFWCCLLQRPGLQVLSFAAPLLPGPVFCSAGASGAVFCSAAAAWPHLLQRH